MVPATVNSRDHLPAMWPCSYRPAPKPVYLPGARDPCCEETQNIYLCHKDVLSNMHSKDLTTIDAAYGNLSTSLFVKTASYCFSMSGLR